MNTCLLHSTHRHPYARSQPHHRGTLQAESRSRFLSLWTVSQIRLCSNRGQTMHQGSKYNHQDILCMSSGQCWSCWKRTRPSIRCIILETNEQHKDKRSPLGSDSCVLKNILRRKPPAPSHTLVFVAVYISYGFCSRTHMRRGTHALTQARKRTRLHVNSKLTSARSISTRSACSSKKAARTASCEHSCTQVPPGGPK